MFQRNRIAILISVSACISACGGPGEPPLDHADSALSADCARAVTTDCIYARDVVRAPGSSMIEGLSVAAAHRDAEIPITIHLPPPGVERSSFETVVWTHGGGFVERPTVSSQGRFWARHLAAAGYVVVLVTHHIPSEWERENFCLEHGVDPSAPLCADIAHAMSPFFKASDTIAVIDDLPRIAGLAARRGVDMDIDALAVGGWSGGSASALRVAGATYDLDGVGTFSIRDERPLAFIAASPTGDERSGFTPLSFSSVDRPVLTITAEGDVTETGPLLPRVRPHYHMPATGDKYQMYLNSDETRHGTMNLSDSAPRQHVQLQASAAIAFLDAKLRGTRRAQRYLDSRLIPALLTLDPSLRSSPPTALDLTLTPVPLWSHR